MRYDSRGKSACWPGVSCRKRETPHAKMFRDNLPNDGVCGAVEWEKQLRGQDRWPNRRQLHLRHGVSGPTSSAKSQPKSVVQAVSQVFANGTWHTTSANRCVSLLTPHRHRNPLTQPFNDSCLRLTVLPPFVIPEVPSHFITLFSLKAGPLRM